MVMGRRPGVATASWPITTADLAGMAGQLAIAMARVPMRSPLSGRETRCTTSRGRHPRDHSLLHGYCSSLPIDEFRSIEVVLDDLCAVVMPPLAKSLGVDTEKSSVGGVPGVWYRPSKGRPRAPCCTCMAAGTLAHRHACTHSSWPRSHAALTVKSLWLTTGWRPSSPSRLPSRCGDRHGSAPPRRRRPGPLLPRRDSGGGGLVTTLIFATQHAHVRSIGGALLFSRRWTWSSTSHRSAPTPRPTSCRGTFHHRLPPWARPGVGVGVCSQSGRQPLACHVRGVGRRGDVPRPDPTVRGPSRVRLRQTVACEQPGMFHVFPILMRGRGVAPGN